MNPRERNLLIIIGVVVGGIVLYNGVKYFFVTPITEADEKIAKLTAETHRLENVIQSRERLARRWTALAKRALSNDPTVALSRLRQDLKSVVERHRITVSSGGVAPISPVKVGSKTGIEAIGIRGSVEGKFAEVLAFLLDVYKT